jgi:hypothetical protein
MPTLEAIIMTDRLIQREARGLLEAALDQSERLVNETGMSIDHALAIELTAVDDLRDRLQARVTRLQREAACRSQ